MDKRSSPDYSAMYLSMQEAEKESKRVYGLAKEKADQAKKKGIDAKQNIELARKLIDGLESIDKDARATLIDAITEANSVANYLIDISGVLSSLTEHTEVIRNIAVYKTRTAEIIKRKTARAQAGLYGAQAKHGKTYALKAWAEQQAATMRGADIDKARKLAELIPAHLAGTPEKPTSKNFVRLIHEHLLSVAKRKRLASQP